MTHTEILRQYATGLLTRTDALWWLRQCGNLPAPAETLLELAAVGVIR